MPGGYCVALRELADVRMVEGPVQISRENGQRRIGIEMNVAGRDIGGFVRRGAAAAAASACRCRPGYYLTWGGQFENQQQAMRRLAIILPVVVGRHLRPAADDVPVGVAGLARADQPAVRDGRRRLRAARLGLYLSVPASVGFIVLFGVAVLNGLVLVSCISQLRAEGDDGGGRRDARVRDAAAGPC